jgi:hypothetical protein
MKKKAFQRGLFGFPVGIAIGYAITIVGSLFWGEGNYAPCVPGLVDTVGSVIGAVALQALLCGLLGASFAAASLVWEKDDWSIAKQTGIYFLIVSVTMFPVAWFSYWMEKSLSGFLSYAVIFVASFAFIWIVKYLIWKQKIKAINKKIEATK